MYELETICWTDIGVGIRLLFCFLNNLILVVFPLVWLTFIFFLKGRNFILIIVTYHNLIGFAAPFFFPWIFAYIYIYIYFLCCHLKKKIMMHILNLTIFLYIKKSILLLVQLGCLLRLHCLVLFTFRGNGALAMFDLVLLLFPSSL